MKFSGKISKAHWFHAIELESGVITPGIVSYSHLKRMADDLRLPEDMSGLVLDVGARDGSFSFEAEKRGARVIAVDIQSLEAIGLGVAREILDSQVSSSGSTSTISSSKRSAGKQTRLYPARRVLIRRNTGRAGLVGISNPAGP